MDPIQFWKRRRWWRDNLVWRRNDLDMYWIDLVSILRRIWHLARGRREQSQEFQNMQRAMRRCSAGAITKFEKQLQFRYLARLNCDRIQVDPKLIAMYAHRGYAHLHKGTPKTTKIHSICTISISLRSYVSNVLNIQVFHGDPNWSLLESLSNQRKRGF